MTRTRSSNSQCPTQTDQDQPLVPAFDGIRALATFWVVSFHVWFASILMIELPARQVTSHSVLLRLAAHGGSGVDVLFILSAALAAYKLVPGLQQHKEGTAKYIIKYWLGRFCRLAPAFYVVLLSSTWEHRYPLEVLAPKYPDAGAARMITNYFCPRGWIPSLFFISNWTIPQVCAAHSWSLSLQMQFFIALPLLLLLLRPSTSGFSHRIITAATLASFIASIYRWHVVEGIGLTTPNHWLMFSDQNFPPGVYKQLSAFSNEFYVSAICRVPNFAVGVILGTLISSPTSIAKLQQYRKLVKSVAVGGWAVLGAALLSPFVFVGLDTWPHPHWVYLYHSQLRYGSLVFSALIGFSMLDVVLYSSRQAQKTPKTAKSFLQSQALKHVSYLSYEIYLLHTQAMYWLSRYILDPHNISNILKEAPVLGFIGHLAATWVVTLMVAWLLSVIVSAPILNLASGFWKEESKKKLN